MTAVRPIYEDLKNSKLIGVAGTEMNLNLIQAKLKSIKTSDNGYAYILQKDGNIIANTLGVPIAGADGKMLNYKNCNNKLVIKSADKLKRGADGAFEVIKVIRTFSTYKGDKEYLTFASTVVDPRGGIEWTVVILIPRSDIFSKVDSMIVLSSSLTAALFVLTLIVTMVVSTYISRPLNVVADAMQNISKLDFEKRASGDSSSSLREIRMIQSSFQVMDTALQSFGKFVPMAVVKRIVADSNNQGQLFLDRRNVTVMFTDIEGFTTLSESISAEALVEILADYLEEVSGIIIATGGTVVDFIGDAVVAIWNAPTDVPDHALCAATCAIRYIRVMGELNNKWLSKRMVKEPLNVRIGVHTGPVYAGNIGSSKRMKYDSIGDTMNLASRLEGLNKRYKTKVIVSEETRNAIQPRMISRPLEYVVVKGKTSRTQVHELLADTQESGEQEVSKANAKQSASMAFQHFTQMTGAQKNDAIAGLSDYCDTNPADKPMKLLLDIVSAPNYDGITVLDDK